MKCPERVKDLTDEIVNERTKIFGKTSSTWECSNVECCHTETSFLYNFEWHISEICSKCDYGTMFENESKRVVPFRAQFYDKSREENWFNSLSPIQQAGILADDKTQGGYY